MFRQLAAIALVSLASLLRAESVPDEKAMEVSQEELRHSIGLWDVVTDILKEVGSVMASTKGTHEFYWIVPDHVAAGKSETEGMSLASGIFFTSRRRKARSR